MREVVWFLRGYLIIEISGATPGWALNRFAKERIAFWNIIWKDAFTVQVCILRQDLNRAEKAIESAMCQGRCVRSVGLRQSAGSILRRPVLVIMLALALAAVAVIPNFVLFYSVSGNETVTDEEILRELQSLGIGFGIYGPRIKPQWIKDHMLNIIPQLQWITVTQNGCRAEVIVRERPEVLEREDRKGFANVIASQGGVITEQSVLAGQALHKVGDTVKKGDILVSGVVDLERVYAIENAQAEIYARTWRAQKTLIPADYQKKVYSGDSWRCIWLVVGEKRIKIFGNSGIYEATCDKMIETRPLSLPGGLELPVSLVIETFTPYEIETAGLTEATAQMLLSSYAEQTAMHQMIAGEVLQRTYDLKEENGCYCLSSILECHEMIAVSVKSDWIKEEIIND